jgi:aminoglycoside 2'-N-acetyltransferase I
MEAVGAHIEDSYEIGALGTGEFGFYERLGWRRWRGPTSVRTEHGRERTPDEDGYVMVLLTPASPVLDWNAELSCEWRPGDVW